MIELFKPKEMLFGVKLVKPWIMKKIMWRMKNFGIIKPIHQIILASIKFYFWDLSYNISGTIKFVGLIFEY